MEIFLTAEAWIALATLATLEIVLGIDNIVFISVLADRLPKHQRRLARRLGLAAALISRLLLLLSLAWIVKLTAPFMTIFGQDFSWRDVVLLSGGLFLLWKATMEMHHLMQPEEDENTLVGKKGRTFASVIAQIAVIDIVFSLDSIITAVGMVDHIEIMVVAVVLAVIVMLIAVDPISEFITKHPTTKMLAFSLLLLIGIALVADGLQFHIPRGYIYFAVAFSLFVEFMNLTLSKKKPN